MMYHNVHSMSHIISHTTDTAIIIYVLNVLYINIASIAGSATDYKYSHMLYTIVA